MPVQKTRNDKEERVTQWGLLGSFFVLAVLISFILGYYLWGIVGNFFLAQLLSFLLVGLLSLVAVHYALPSDVSRFDTRLLHELAKRHLIEFQEQVEHERAL